MKLNKSTLTIFTLLISASFVGPVFNANAVSIFENGTPQYDTTYPYNISDSLKILDRAENSISKNPDSIRWKSVPEHLLRAYLWNRDSYHDSDTIKLANTWIELADKVKDRDYIEYAKLTNVFANLLKQNFKEAEKSYKSIKFDKYNKDDIFTSQLINTLMGEEKEAKANLQGNKNYSFSYTIRIIRIEDAEKLVKDFPKSDIARYVYALALQKKAEENSLKEQTNVDYKEVINQLDQALSINSSNTLYELKRAILNYDPVNYDLSDQKFEDIYRKSYKDSYIAESIATNYARYNRVDKSLEYIREAIKQDPSRVGLYKKLNSLYAYSNNFEELIPIYEDAINKYPDKVELYYDLGDLYLKTKADPSKNVELFEKAVQKNPTNDSLYVYLADSYYSARDFKKAAGLYQESIKLNKNNIDAYGKLIGLYWDEADNDNLIKVADQAIKNNPAYTMGYLWIGSAYLRQNKVDEAIQIIKKAIDIKPDFALGYNSLGIAYKTQKKYDMAIEQFKKAVAINPSYQEAVINIGDSYAQKNDYAQAEKTYNQILVAEPYNEAVLFALGNLYTENKNYEKSVSSFEKAILLNPKSLDARNNLGNVYLKQNKLDQAIEEFEKVLKIDPKYATAYYNIACIYSLKMDKNYSLRFLEEALSLDNTLKDVAKADPDFKNIQDDNRFKELVN